MRALIRERENRHTSASLQHLILGFRNCAVQPQTQSGQEGLGAAGASMPSGTPDFQTVRSVIGARAFAFNTARATITSANEQLQRPLLHQPINRQAAAVQTLVRRRGLLHVAKLQVDLALSFLRRHDNEDNELVDLDLDTSALLKRMRRRLVEALKEARTSVEEHCALLEIEEEEAREIFADVNLPPSGELSLQTGAATQTDTDAARATQRESTPPVRHHFIRLSRRGLIPIPSTPADTGTKSSTSEPISLLRERYQALSTASRKIESAADAQFRLALTQKKAYAAAMPCRIHPISKQTSTALSCVNKQLNTQNTLPGSPHSRRNLMLHLHNIMNRQLLKEMPTDQAQLRDFFSAPNAVSGLSGLSVVQMLAAALRASPHPMIKEQIEEILNSQTIDGIAMARLLDRTHEEFISADQMLAMFDTLTPATTNRYIRLLSHSVLEICKLALIELQLPKGAS
ncbi:MAG: hypothetical protein ACRC9T_03680 [Vibrionaceae bacterium]